MLNDGTCYQDLGPAYFARRNPAIAAKLADRIRNLGFHIKISAPQLRMNHAQQVSRESTGPKSGVHFILPFPLPGMIAKYVLFEKVWSKTNTKP